jgi:hypothetical protein
MWKIERKITHHQLFNCESQKLRWGVNEFTQTNTMQKAGRDYKLLCNSLFELPNQLLIKLGPFLPLSLLIKYHSLYRTSMTWLLTLTFLSNVIFAEPPPGFYLQNRILFCFLLY